MRQPLIAGNWKMNGSRASVNALLRNILTDYQALDDSELVIFPPFVFMQQVQELLTTTPIAWGGQTISEKESGAYTGEISAAMLLDFGCRYVLVGHSERRLLFDESNAIVAAKFLAAAKAGLHPVLCVGETLQQHNAGETEQVIQAQIETVIAQAGINYFTSAVIAYEPVWAIGTGVTASPHQAQEIHAFIREFMIEYDKNIAQRLRILYGGSMKADNARALLQMPDIDGGLVGGASLNAREFIEIARACKH